MINLQKTLLLPLMAVPAMMMAAPVTPLWLRDVKIAPDGQTIAFAYGGDIWTVPAVGGQALRLTSNPAYESVPVWSPDGSKIAFASDLYGSNDIFVIDATGGKPARLTANSSANETPEAFSADGKSVLYSAHIQDPARSAMFPTGRMTELYSVPVAGGASRQVLATPAQMISWLDNDGDFVYQDVKGFEDEWRKHHTSSVTRDIWRYDAKTGKHTNLTARPGEDRNPVGDGQGNFYFISERGEGPGTSLNVYVAPLDNPTQARPVTDFKTHPVRFLSRGANGLLCYTYDGEIYTQTPDGKPQKVAITIVDDVTQQPQKVAVKRAGEVAPSPDGKSVAFTNRGEVFVTSTEYSTTKQVTNTVEAEGEVAWDPKGKYLVYSSERDGLSNIYKAEMARPDDDGNWANATLITETAMFKPDKTERQAPRISPDGTQMAFIADRNKLMVMDLKTKKVRQLTDGSTWTSRSGGFDYSWSPDSKWIAMEIVDRRHDPYTDIALLNVADGTVTNLTNSGYFAASPRWALDGNAILYATDKYGMRNHASWGSQNDAMLVFMNNDAFDKYRLSPEDYALQKDLEKKGKRDKGASSDKDTADVKTIDVQLAGITDRTVRVTPMSTDLRDAAISADGDNLYYLINSPDGTQLWKLAMRKDEHKMLAKAEGMSGIRTADAGKTLFLTGKSIKKLDTKTDKLTPVTYKGTITVDGAREREYMFDNMAREEAERFYTASMHGVDWPAMTKHYRKFLPHINNNYDYAELLSEILGELNVSHTGGRYYAPSGDNDERTANLGLLFDMAWDGDGLRIDEVVAKGPFDRQQSMAAKGMIVEKINGSPIKRGQDATPLLTDIIGQKTLVSIYDPKSGQRWDQVVIPVSNAKVNSLLYDRWVKARAADVDRWSGGRLGYVHIPSMADPAFRTLYADVLGKYNDRDGIVIDVRWNGGGRMHEDIEVMFSGKKYLTQEIRGTQTCDMPSRRWNKPSVMVVAEPCYSNAHGTPWVYQHQGLGKVVGAPVPGTMTSVNWVTMQDPTLIFGIPVIGYRTAEGNFLENTQLEPDIVVYNTPEQVAAGDDAQLHAAVNALLADIDAQTSQTK